MIARRSLASTASTSSSPAVSTVARRSFATVQDPPKKTHGGLKDQDRIFQNAYMRHDHLLKGAMVSRRTRRTRVLIHYARCGRRVSDLSALHFLPLLGARRLAQDQGDPSQGSRLDHCSDEGFGYARTWWRRFPLWSQVVLHAQARMGEGPPPPLPRGQCR